MADGHELVLGQRAGTRAARAIDGTGSEAEIGASFANSAQNTVREGVDDRNLDVGMSGEERVQSASGSKLAVSDGRPARVTRPRRAAR